MQSISLFHPSLLIQSEWPSFSDFDREEAIADLQDAELCYSASETDLAATDIMAKIDPDNTRTLLLLSGDHIPSAGASDDSTIATMGALIPATTDSPSRNMFGNVFELVLFQLEPVLEILGVKNQYEKITDLLHVDVEDGTTKAHLPYKGSLRFGAENGTGLLIDCEAGIATLRSVPTNLEEDAGEGIDEGNQKPKPAAFHDVDEEYRMDGWQSKMQIRRLEVYTVPGGLTVAELEPPKEETLEEKIDAFGSEW